MAEAFICDAVRTLIGRYGGSLAAVVRPDDLASAPLRALRDRNPTIDWSMVDEILTGCANLAGEDIRTSVSRCDPKNVNAAGSSG